MLILSLRSNNMKIELECYDLIGMQYYYLGDIKTAKSFHRRYQDNILQPKNDIFVGMCIRD